MSQLNQMVHSVNINGEVAELGGEMTVAQAQQEMEALGLMGSVQGATPTVVDGVLSFTYARGDKGLR